MSQSETATVSLFAAYRGREVNETDSLVVSDNGPVSAVSIERSRGDKLLCPYHRIGLIVWNGNTMLLQIGTEHLKLIGVNLGPIYYALGEQRVTRIIEQDSWERFDETKPQVETIHFPESVPS